MPNADGRGLALHRDDEGVVASGTAQHYRLERWERRTAWSSGPSSPGFRSATVGGHRRDNGMFRDVTEQKRAEERVQEAVRPARSVPRDAVARAPNPLGAVVTAAALLKKQRVGASPPGMLDILQRQSLQMARLLDDCSRRAA